MSQSNSSKQKKLMMDEIEVKLTLEEISLFFHLPQQMAAAKLSVPIPVLKNRCRELGIKRWPYLKNKRKNSEASEKYSSEFNHFKLENPTTTTTQIPQKKHVRIKKIHKTEPSTVKKITINQKLIMNKLKQEEVFETNLKHENFFIDEKQNEEDEEEDDFTKNIQDLTQTYDGNLLTNFKKEFDDDDESNGLLGI